MTGLIRRVSCAFVVCKLRLGGEDYFLLRMDPAWEDLTLAGGHEAPVDEGDLQRTAARETEEELSGLTWRMDFVLTPVTAPIVYGPVWSRSARQDTEYVVQYYHLRFVRPPCNIKSLVRSGALNVLVKERDLLGCTVASRISDWVKLLDKEVPGGLRSLPYSWDDDLGTPPEQPPSA